MTVIVCVPAAVPFAAVALTTSLFEELTDNRPEIPGEIGEGLEAGLESRHVALEALQGGGLGVEGGHLGVQRLLRGASICRMASTVEVTSMPLPEVLVAEFRMAFTASWIADVGARIRE